MKYISILLLLMAFSLPATAAADQASSGDQSPVIKAQGDVNITYGVPQAVVDRLLKELDDKDVVLQDKESKLEEMLRKYKELEARLAQRSDTDAVASKARGLLEQGDLDGAEALFSQSLEQRLGKLASQQKQAASDAFELASIAAIKLDYNKAATYFKQAARLAPDNGLYLNGYGFVLHTLGQYDKAIEYYGKALAIGLQVFGDKHPNVAAGYNNLGSAWQDKGQYDKAIEYLSKALAIDLQVFGDKHPNVARTYNNLGEAWRAKGQYDKAIEYYGKALAIGLQVFGDKHPNVARTYNNLGLAWHAKGQYDKAIEYLSKALAIDLQVFGDKHPNVARTYNNLGGAWHAKGQYDKAIEYLSKALAIVESALGVCRT